MSECQRHKVQSQVKKSGSGGPQDFLRKIFVNVVILFQRDSLNIRKIMNHFVVISDENAFVKDPKGCRPPLPPGQGWQDGENKIAPYFLFETRLKIYLTSAKKKKF